MGEGAELLLMATLLYRYINGDRESDEDAQVSPLIRFETFRSCAHHQMLVMPYQRRTAIPYTCQGFEEQEQETCR